MVSKSQYHKKIQCFDGIALFDFFPRMLPSPRKSEILNDIVLCVIDGTISLCAAQKGIAFLLMDRKNFYKKFRA